LIAISLESRRGGELVNLSQAALSLRCRTREQNTSV